MPSNWGKTDSTKLQTEDSSQCDMICVMSVVVFFKSRYWKGIYKHPQNK